MKLRPADAAAEKVSENYGFFSLPPSQSLPGVSHQGVPRGGDLEFYILWPIFFFFLIPKSYIETSEDFLMNSEQ